MPLLLHLHQKDKKKHNMPQCLTKNGRNMSYRWCLLKKTKIYYVSLQKRVKICCKYNSCNKRMKICYIYNGHPKRAQNTVYIKICSKRGKRCHIYYDYAKMSSKCQIYIYSACPKMTQLCNLYGAYPKWLKYAL